LNEFNVSVTESPLAIRGEYEILVCDAPIFSHKIRFEKAKRIWDRKTGSGYLEIAEAKLVEKSDCT